MINQWIHVNIKIYNVFKQNQVRGLMIIIASRVLEVREETQETILDMNWETKIERISE
jgi:hypothetical protein